MYIFVLKVMVVQEDAFISLFESQSPHLIQRCECNYETEFWVYIHHTKTPPKWYNLSFA